MKSESYGNQFLYAEDLLVGGQYRQVDVEIEKYIPEGTLRSADGKPINKPTLKFTGKDKLLVLCKTNSSIIHFVTGEPPGDKWIGKRIAIQPRMVDAFGEQVVAIRVIPPKGCLVRKNVLKRLGTKADWHACTTSEKLPTTPTPN